MKKIAILPDIERYRTLLATANRYTFEGRVDQIIGMTVEATGIECDIGNVCNILQNSGRQEILAEVVGFRANKVLLMPYQDIDGIGYGSTVRNTGGKLSIRMGSGLIGRTVDALGNPIDGGPPIEAEAEYPIQGKPSNPMTRPRISRPLQIGVKAIDGLLTVGKGQRIGIFSGSGVGKSTLMGMIARNVKADVNVIALVGKEGARSSTSSAVTSARKAQSVPCLWWRPPSSRP